MNGLTTWNNWTGKALSLQILSDTCLVDDTSFHGMGSVVGWGFTDVDTDVEGKRQSSIKCLGKT